MRDERIGVDEAAKIKITMYAPNGDEDVTMQLAVLVEHIDEQKYRAETGQPVSLIAEGRTREEAVGRLLELAQQRLSAGEIVHLELSDVADPHPWTPYAGVWKDHPDFDAFLDNIANDRRQLDQAEPEE